MAWAVDRDELVALALDGLGRPLSSWLASNPVYAEARRTGYVKYDPVRAGQLLDEAGWRLPAGGRVRTRNGAPLAFRLVWWGNNRPLAEVLQGQWARVGADVTVEGSTDYGFLVARRAENNWESFIESQSTFGDPAPIVARHLAPDGVNFYHQLRDAEIDRLLAGFDQLPDPEERRQQALRVNERHAEIMPFIPLASRDRLVAVSRSLRNFTPHFLSAQYEVHPDLWVSA
jgi:ABC-type transport system substrate-binding protein